MFFCRLGRISIGADSDWIHHHSVLQWTQDSLLYLGSYSFVSCFAYVKLASHTEPNGDCENSCLWFGNSALIQADASLNGNVGIDWVNTFLWLVTAAVSGVVCRSRGGLRIKYVPHRFLWRARKLVVADRLVPNRSWRLFWEPTLDDPEASRDQVEDCSAPPIARVGTDPQPWHRIVSQQGTSSKPDDKKESSDNIVELSRRYQELLEEQQQARQEIAKLRTELAGEERRRGFLYVRRRARLFGGGSRLYQPST